MGERSYLSIGDVLSQLREEFPDITISKIRFLESRGLLVPERTPSGYRKFYEHDVDRLRWILRQQRENFLPLKVIKGRLEGQEPSSEPTQLFDVATGADAPAPLEPRYTRHQGNGLQGGAEPPEAEAGAGAVATRRSTVAAAVPRVTAAASEITPQRTADPRAERGTADLVAAADEATDFDGGEETDVAAGRNAVASPTGREPGPGRAAVARVATPRGMSDVAASSGAALTAAPPPASGAEPTPDRPSAVGAEVASGAGAPAGADAGPGAAGAPAGAEPRRSAGAEQPGAAGSERSVDNTPAGANVRGGPDPVGHAGPAADAAPAAAGMPPRRAEAKLDSASLTGASLTAAELAQASGLDVAQVEELESYGLIESRMVADAQCYDEEALMVCRLAEAFARYGIEARHLRLFKHAAERQASLYSQIVMPLLRQRNPDARRRASDDLTRLTELGASMQACFAKAVLRDLTRG